ncbi:Xylose isomerase domain-containing protein TIM barrel [Actinobacteria bacterium OK074]|nr:Xylose isomerase domain-containing protein TIM barrel [Actinobacteria bacterium OK074]
MNRLGADGGPNDGPDDRRWPSVGLEHLTFHTDPLSVFIDAAVAGGARSVCLSVNHRDVLDRTELRETLARLKTLDISVAMGDGFLIAPTTSPTAARTNSPTNSPTAQLDRLRRGLDVIAEAGASFANACAYEPDAHVPRDPERIEDVLGEFCQVARTAQVDVLIEFTPLSHVPSLAAAVALLERLDQPNLKILVDTLHLVRAGEGPDDLRRVDHHLIGYCQLSDGLLASESLDSYLDLASNERVIPGQGEFPLEEMLALLPPDVTVSAEVPLRSLEQAGVPPEERARRILDGSRRVLARARPAHRTSHRTPTARELP